jgi:CRP-like cAMP-binding protein
LALHFFYELAENDRHSKDAKENSLGTWKIVRDHSKDEGESGHQGEEGDVFWLKDYIEPLDITVTFVAEMLGVSRKAVSAIVNERKSNWASSNIGTAVPYNALLNRSL